jgi:hypothetical protein
MSMRAKRGEMSIVLAVATMIMASCGSGTMSDERIWSQSVAAPAHLQFWEGSGKIINLPAARADFIEAVLMLGGHYYVTGEGEAASLSAPPPLEPDSPCRQTRQAIVVDFPRSRTGETPGYVAYMNDADVVVCVDRQFSYMAP